jgi:hypothetical protein
MQGHVRMAVAPAHQTTIQMIVTHAFQVLGIYQQQKNA